MQAVFIGLTTLDVAQLVSKTVAENQKVTSLAQLICAGGPATNAAVTFARLEAKKAAASQNQTKVRPYIKTSLLSALGKGKTAEIIRADLQENQVNAYDCTDFGDATQTDFTTAVSTIFVNRSNGARTLASTNSRLPLTVQLVEPVVNDQPTAVMLVDGHNPKLAEAALKAHLPQAHSVESFAAADPFAAVETKPNYLRILDGGSWKPWLPSLLPFIDVAIISADFTTPLGGGLESTVEFLRGFGITKVIQTNGEASVRWFWENETGQVEVPQVETVCTLGAGDIFHGAFAWYCADQGNLQSTGQVVKAIEFASSIAAKSVQTFGTRPDNW
ncbi:PfkB family carbohydrate kinase [Gleimia sp. 6138-11-ORH1]|uniref:PfkB family carbohydrate kinase n=1 Tax=Gleimia sp. 6138-11-ORH1 TaxID=2973937 RepID=UPI00216A3AD9|nr:PfkB family carbohydrate kinase [Gleimia sp. 6138-11-ORH1]MCS4485096.1 PfkB family carbohydrate kinase [Gleimia sp. 6138-11-ORH1]